MMRAESWDGNLWEARTPAARAWSEDAVLASRLQRRTGRGPARRGCAVEPLLLEFVQGTLSPGYLERVDAHLGGCERCQARLLELLPDACPGTDMDTAWSTCTVSTFAPGAWLSARYAIRGLLGRGGMGEVYEALDTWFAEAIALKALVATDCDSSSALDRLVLEARLARRVSHPNVCRTYDVGLHENGARGERLAFITMELIRGVPLGQFLRQNGPLKAQAVQRIGLEILQGLAALHQTDIIHRDIKCNNVLVCAEPSARRSVAIVDFGLAVERSASANGLDSSMVRNVEGTMAYMAPEQLAGRPVVPATDVYGFGATLYEMVTGQSPFSASAPGVRCYPSPAAAQLLRAAPLHRPELEAFLQKCLSLEPAARFADAGAALSAFQTLW